MIAEMSPTPPKRWKGRRLYDVMNFTVPRSNKPRQKRAMPYLVLPCNRGWCSTSTSVTE